MRTITLVFAVLTSAATVPAQSTFVVDASGRPGSHFTDLPTAIAAVSPGDILLVRDGQYVGFQTSKPLKIHAAAGAKLSTVSTIVIQNLPAGTDFVLQGFELYVAYPGLRVQNCRGRVLLAGLTTTGLVGDIRIDRCDQVAIDDCTFAPPYWRGPLTVTQSTLLVTNSRIHGKHAEQGHAIVLPAKVGVDLIDADVRFSRTDLRGGDGLVILSWLINEPSTPALRMLRSTVTITGAGGMARVFAGAGGPRAISAIDGTGGRLTLRPNVPVIPFGAAPPIAAGIPVVRRDVPSLAMTRAAIGGTANLDLFAHAGDVYALFVSLPGPPQVLPNVTGTYWMDPNLPPLFFGVGLAFTSRIIISPLPVPNDPVLHGVVLRWQGVSGPVAGPFEFSNPVTYSHGW